MELCKGKKRKQLPLTNYFSVSKELQTEEKCKRKCERPDSILAQDENSRTRITPPSDEIKEVEKGYAESEEGDSEVKNQDNLAESSGNELSIESHSCKERGVAWGVSLATLRDGMNLANKIYVRSVLGTRTIKLSPRVVRWCCPSWINFQMGCSHVTTMSFDAVGVLLAVACEDGSIKIYDWDMVVAADLKGRNRLLRKQSGPPFSVDPVVDFGLPRKSISFLQWNPFQQDVLAVGNRQVVSGP